MYIEQNTIYYMDHVNQVQNTNKDFPNGDKMGGLIDKRDLLKKA